MNLLAKTALLAGGLGAAGLAIAKGLRGSSAAAAAGGGPAPLPNTAAPPPSSPAATSSVQRTTQDVQTVAGAGIQLAQQLVDLSQTVPSWSSSDSATAVGADASSVPPPDDFASSGDGFDSTSTDYSSGDFSSDGFSY